MTGAALVLAIAPTGARKTKKDHPNLPISPVEISEEAAVCLAAGASMIHLHVRDTAGVHTLDPDTYQQSISALRNALADSLVIQMTTEAVGLYTAPEQIAAVRAVRPEAVSISITEIVPDSASEESAQEFFAWMRSEGVVPQFILYSPEEVVEYASLRQRGIILGAEHSILFVLGRYAVDQRSSPTDLVPFVSAYEAQGIEVPWMVCAFGEREAECMAAAISLGGHVRVGFENNQTDPNGQRADRNDYAVGLSASVGRVLGRPIADAAVARRVLRGVNATNGNGN